MRRSGVLRANDLPAMTGKELQCALAELGPCVESAQGVLLTGEIRRRASKGDRHWVIIAAITSALISAVASQWDKFVWWLKHLF